MSTVVKTMGLIVLLSGTGFSLCGLEVAQALACVSASLGDAPRTANNGQIPIPSASKQIRVCRAAHKQLGVSEAR